ncbi:MAG: DinB family protein [Pyrinomonadaceae bacterium]|nr:DinB family protein [Chloracidobacterium sp.]
MKKDILIEQFNACYDKNTWFVALKNTLAGVTAADAAWKPGGVDNSIWEIVSHLNYYNFAYVERFKGVDYQYPADDNDATFVAGDATEEAWKAEVAKLDAVMTEFRDLIKNADDSKFDEPVSATNPASWATLISNINAHNAHHGGQIVLLRKMQGSWDRAKGVS